MIIGDKICIRPIEPSDAGLFAKWWSDGSMMEHAGFPFGTMESTEAIKNNIIKKSGESNFFGGSGLFVICIKETMKPIGELSYSDWDRRSQSVEFGIKLGEVSEQGKGYGEEALRLFIDFLFRHLNVNRIHLSTMPYNKRAQSLYKKLGFQQCGQLREAYFNTTTNKYEDMILMDLLRKEWYK